jgi:hypothetical protein
MKFGRNYKLTIQTNPLITATPLPGTVNPSVNSVASTSGDNQAIVVTPPLTIRFNVSRGGNQKPSMQLQVYNLSPNTRDRIRHDRFSSTKLQKVILEAGYDNLSVIFKGDIFSASSVRESETNIVTYIDCRDGGYDLSNTKTYQTMAGGTPLRSAFFNLIGQFPTLAPGHVGEIEGTALRPLVLAGNTWDLVRMVTVDGAFVDLGQVHVLKNGEAIVRQDLQHKGPASIPLISPETGLLGAPQREDAFIQVKTLFEPTIIIGELVSLKSTVAPQYDGQYKVIGITHNGTISGAVNGTCYTTFQLIKGDQLAGGFTQVTA